MTNRRDLYPPIDPYRTGTLRLDARHAMYWEQSGNPRGAQAAGGGRRIGADRRPGCRTLQILVPGRPDGARLGRGAAELHRLVMLGQLAQAGVQLVEQGLFERPRHPAIGHDAGEPRLAAAKQGHRKAHGPRLKEFSV